MLWKQNIRLYNTTIIRNIVVWYNTYIKAHAYICPDPLSFSKSSTCSLFIFIIRADKCQNEIEKISISTILEIWYILGMTKMKSENNVLSINNEFRKHHTWTKTYLLHHTKNTIYMIPYLYVALCHNTMICVVT